MTEKQEILESIFDEAYNKLLKDYDVKDEKSKEILFSSKDHFNYLLNYSKLSDKQLFYFIYFNLKWTLDSPGFPGLALTA